MGSTLAMLLFFCFFVGFPIVFFFRHRSERRRQESFDFFSQPLMQQALPYVIAIVAVIVLLCIYALFRAIRRHRAISRAAADAQAGHFGSVDGSMLKSLTRFQLFEHYERCEGQIRDLCYRFTDDGYLGLFEYKYLSGDGENTSTHLQTVLHAYSEKFILPAFVLRPRGLLDKLTTFFKSAVEVDFSDYPEFSRRYIVLSQDAQLTRLLFDERIIAFFEEQTKLRDVEADGRELVCRVHPEANPHPLMEVLNAFWVLVPFVGMVLGWRLRPADIAPGIQAGEALHKLFARDDARVIDTSMIDSGRPADEDVRVFNASRMAVNERAEQEIEFTDATVVDANEAAAEVQFIDASMVDASEPAPEESEIVEAVMTDELVADEIEIIDSPTAEPSDQMPGQVDVIDATMIDGRASAPDEAEIIDATVIEPDNTPLREPGEDLS